MPALQRVSANIEMKEFFYGDCVLFVAHPIRRPHYCTIERLQLLNFTYDLNNVGTLMSLDIRFIDSELSKFGMSRSGIVRQINHKSCMINRVVSNSAYVIMYV